MEVKIPRPFVFEIPAEYARKMDRKMYYACRRGFRIIARRLEERVKEHQREIDKMIIDAMTKGVGTMEIKP